MLKNNYLSMAFFLSMFLLLLIVFIAWKYKKIPVAIKLSLIMLATFFYLGGYAFEVMIPDRKVIQFCLQVENLGIPFIPVLWLILISDCTGFAYLKKSHYWKLFVIPVLTLIIQQTNDWHYLFYRNFSYLQGSGYTVAYFEKGPWYWIHIIYSYLSVAACVILLIKYIKENGLYRKEILAFSMAISISWIYYLFYLFNEKKLLNWTPVGIAIGDIILAFIIYRMNLLKITPIALENVFRFMSEAVIVLDNHDQIVYFNGPAADIIPELKDIKADQNQMEVFQKYPVINDILCGNLAAETRFQLRRNGMLGVYKLKLTFISKKKLLLGKMLILSDITAIEKSKKDLSITSAQLSALNILKDRLIKIVINDIKEPLDMLMNLTELLKSKEIDPIMKKEILNEIQKNINCIYLRIESMLDYFQNKQHNNIYAPMNWKLSLLAKEAVNSVVEKAKKKNISISCFIDDNIIVYADKEMIDIVLKNLLSNAVKFTNRNGRVTVTAQREGDYIILSVKDTGIGIDAERIQMLFQDVEADPIPGTEGEMGMGLGLLLSRQIIKRNYGDIWVDSTVGKGSDFYISIPAANENN